MSIMTIENGLNKRFLIALSFASEKKTFVEKVADILAKRFGKGRILYYEYHRALFATPDLASKLPQYYCDDAELIVVVLCRDYQSKPWCGLEWNAIHGSITMTKQLQQEQVMLCHFDRVEMKDLYGRAGYLDLDLKTPNEFASDIMKRLALNQGLPEDHYIRDTPDWPIEVPPLKWFAAGQHNAQTAFARLIKQIPPFRLLLIRGNSGSGKTHLIKQFRNNAKNIRGISSAALNFSLRSDRASALRAFANELNVGLPKAYPSNTDPLIAIFECLKNTERPTLIFFDTFEQAGDAGTCVQEHLLSSLAHASWLRVIIVGQKVPAKNNEPWKDISSDIIELCPATPQEWLDYGRLHQPGLTLEIVRKYHELFTEKVDVLATILCDYSAELLEKVLQSKGNTEALLALAIVHSMHQTRSDTERSQIKDALLAAALPNSCSADLLTALLKTTPKVGERLLSKLLALPFVEPFPIRGEHAVYVHETFRIALHAHLKDTDPARWEALSKCASNYIGRSPDEYSRIEAMVHLSATNRDEATSTANSLTQEFINTANSDAYEAIARTLAEPTATDWLNETAKEDAAQPESRLAAARHDVAVPFHPSLVLRNAHLMTLVPRYVPRDTSLAGVPQEARFFTVSPQVGLQGFCHWQNDRKSSPTVLLVHGIEGSSESRYMRGIAAKAYRVGFNVIRLNQRTCGGTEHLSPTLYNSGLSGDYRAIIRELAHLDRLDRIWLAGYSMGGNLVLKAAGELAETEPALAGVAAVCPNINPTVCARALEEPQNIIYHRHFLTRLKSRLRRKAALQHGKWDLSVLDKITTISEFDDRYTAHDGGYRDGADYYDRSGARHMLHTIAVPTLIIAAQDDPFIPYSIFTVPQIQQQPHIRLVAPRYGGHCGFFQASPKGEDPYWAENRIVDFLQGRL